jgi:hypothetical protein
MANFGEMAARLVDIYGSPATANPTKLAGNLTVSNNGNVLIGTSTDDGTNKLQVSGTLAFIGAQTITSSASRIGLNKTSSASLTNSVQSSLGLSIEGYDGTGANLRLMANSGASISTLFRDDGSNFYILHTVSNYGAWNAWRPFTLNHSTGDMWLQSDNSASVIVGGSTNLSSSFNLQVHGRGAQIPLALHNMNQAYSTYWLVGPDSANSFVVYNQAGSGVYVASGGTSWIANSDERLKNIKSYLSDAVTKVNSLRCITYTWKKDDDHALALGEDASDSRVYVGLVAQDVLNVQPEAVATGVDGYLGVSYSELVPLALAAIKELSAEIEVLKQEITELKAK